MKKKNEKSLGVLPGHKVLYTKSMELLVKIFKH